MLHNSCKCWSFIRIHSRSLLEDIPYTSMVRTPLFIQLSQLGTRPWTPQNDSFVHWLIIDWNVKTPRVLFVFEACRQFFLQIPNSFNKCHIFIIFSIRHVPFSCRCWMHLDLWHPMLSTSACISFSTLLSSHSFHVQSVPKVAPFPSVLLWSSYCCLCSSIPAW